VQANPAGAGLAAMLGRRLEPSGRAPSGAELAAELALGLAVAPGTALCRALVMKESTWLTLAPA
jgi:hypothetical protein